MDPILMLFVSMIVLWVPQNVIHEGSHALVAWRSGAKIERFWPFPSKKTGSFTFAHVKYKCGKDVKRDSWAWVHISPIIANTFGIVIGATLALIVDHPTKRMIPLAFAFNNALDGINNCRIGVFSNLEKSNYDIAKWVLTSGVPRSSVRWYCAVWAFLAILLCVYTAFRY